MSDDFKRGALLIEFPCDGPPSSNRWIRIYEGSDSDRVVLRHEFCGDGDAWKTTRSELLLDRRELVQLSKALLEIHKRLSSRAAKRTRKETA